MQRQEESATEKVRKLPTHLHVYDPSVELAYAPHGRQPLYPVLSLNVSEGHNKHWVMLLAPTSGLYVPIGHGDAR
jgi:hypothetical protein